MDPKGYFALVLHAHLPFVRHPEHDRFLEEDWFFEALTEPICRCSTSSRACITRRALPRDDVAHTHPALDDDDPLLQQRYVRYLDERLEALKGESRRTENDAYFHPVVQFYTDLYARLRRRFVEQDRLDVTQAFRR